MWNGEMWSRETKSGEIPKINSPEITFPCRHSPENTSPTHISENTLPLWKCWHFLPRKYISPFHISPFLIFPEYLKRNTVRYVKEMRSGEMYFRGNVTRGNVNRRKKNRGNANTRTGTIPPILSRFAIFYDFETVKIQTFASKATLRNSSKLLNRSRGAPKYYLCENERVGRKKVWLSVISSL
jgi:hypothetical protein